MSVPVILRPEAECDVRTIHADLERIQPGLGDHFKRRLKDLLARIEFMPAAYAILWEDIRAARVKRFRYVVYYVLFEDRAEVLGVVHGSRDESAWQSRR